MPRFCFILLLVFIAQCTPLVDQDVPEKEASEIFHSRKAHFRLELVAEGMKTPWSMAWLPDGQALISDRRGGAIYKVTPGDTTRTPLCNAPEPFTMLDSGMREVLIPDNFSEQGWVFLSYDANQPDSSSTLVVERAKIQGDCFAERQVLFEALPWYKSEYHYGGRLLWDEGYLFITVGDRHFRDSAQLLNTHNGKIIRLKDDGQIPPDNPFVGQPEALPEIWSFGHRNPQGLAIHPETKQIWEHEHGPKGGDEINIIHPGQNYGWPIITHGEEYEGGPVGADIRYKPDMEQPFRHYSPSVAPSGMTFYTGSDFPEWEGNLFFGAMSQRNLYRLVIVEGRIRGEERLLESKGWRIRFIKQGPDHFLYFGTDEGQVWKILPVAIK